VRVIDFYQKSTKIVIKSQQMLRIKVRNIFINMQGIYKIVNKNNGKYYVGSSNRIEKRWNRHRLDLRKNKHVNPKLQAAWNFHGEECFKFEVTEQLDGISPEKLKEVEDRYLAICEQDKDSNYNCFYVSSNIGSLSEQRKNHLSEVMKKIPRNIEWRRKIGEANHRRGRLPEASIQKMRDKLTGRKIPFEIIARRPSKKNVPMRRSDMTIRTFYNYKTNEQVTLPTFDFSKKYNIKEVSRLILGKVDGTRSGWTLSPTYRGYVCSNEHRKKLSEMSRKVRQPCSEETKRKIRESKRKKINPVPLEKTFHPTLPEVSRSR
jgi:group I intron endonuclease